MAETDKFSSPPLLVAEDLVRHFPSARGAAVAGVSFMVGHGELVALLGPSGCGKTTTLRLIGGFERADAGRLFLSGRDVTAVQPERRGIGFVFQDYALFPHLTVRQNVAFGLKAQARRARDARVDEMLALIDMDDLAERMPHQLSGGQQQRVALARTLAVAPPLVLLDEPFSNLDATMRIDTRQEVRNLLKAAGSAAILVTHDQEEALALADRIAVMHEGRVLQMDSPDEIYRRPASSFVARFIGRSNIVAAKGCGAVARTAFGSLALERAVHGEIQVALRPEQIVLTPAAGPSEAQVVGREFRGHDQLYWVRTGKIDLLAISGPETNFTVGDHVTLTAREPVMPIE